MTFDQILSLVGFGLTFLSSLAGLAWFLMKEIRSGKDTSIAAIRDVQTANVEHYHRIDKRIQSVEQTVSPYAASISKLEDQQTKNTMELVELKSKSNQIQRDYDRQQMEIKGLQQQQRRA